MTKVEPVEDNERLQEELIVVGLYDAQPEKQKDVRAISDRTHLEYSRCYYILKKHGRIDSGPPDVGSRSKTISEFHATLGQHIQSYRYKANSLGAYDEVSPQEMANNLGWSLKKYRRIEWGTSEPSIRDLQQIAAHNRVTLSYMFTKVEQYLKNAAKTKKDH